MLLWLLNNMVVVKLNVGNWPYYDTTAVILSRDSSKCINSSRVLRGPLTPPEGTC